MAKKVRKGMFYEKPHHRWLAKLITFKSITEARKNAAKLVRKAKHSRRDTAVTIKRALVLARNRAKASLKRKGLDRSTRHRLSQIAKIYEKAYKRINLD